MAESKDALEFRMAARLKHEVRKETHRDLTNQVKRITQQQHTTVTLAAREASLRGIPAIGPNVDGAIPGTNPGDT